MPIFEKITTQKALELVPICPFCETEMEDLGVNSEPATFRDNKTADVCSGVWLQYHRFVCHSCGFGARFQDSFLSKYKGKAST